MSGVFEAQYPGVCGVCDERIVPGDRCAYIDDDSRAVGVVIAHVHCPQPVVLADPCSKCFMIPAANGTCGCDP